MKKRYRWIIVIVFICVIALVWNAYALYTSRSYQKAVVSTTRDEVPFSSNYLKLIQYSEKEPDYSVISPTITLKDGDSNVSFAVTVNNFPLTRTSQTATKPISYTAVFQVEGGTGSYSVKRNSTISSEKINTSASISHTLQTGSHTDTYVITMPAADLGKAKIKICVRPDKDSLATVSNMMLAGELHPMEAVKDTAFACVGEFQDKDSGKQPYDYDAFRYHIYITKGQAAVSLSWDPDYVIPDPGFKELVNGQYSEDKKTLTFHMDYDEMEAYDVIFYRKKGKNSSELWQKSWTELSKYISVSGEESK